MLPVMVSFGGRLWARVSMAISGSMAIDHMAVVTGSREFKAFGDACHQAVSDESHQAWHGEFLRSVWA
jgi:hypothetical protein